MAERSFANDHVQVEFEFAKLCYLIQGGDPNATFPNSRTGRGGVCFMWREWKDSSGQRKAKSRTIVHL